MECTGKEFEFCSVLAGMISGGGTVGATGKVFDNLGALSTENNLLTLRRLMLATKPARTLEIGLSFGGSSLVFASTHRDLKHSPPRRHTALDPFQETVWDSCGLMALDRAGLAEYLDFRPAFSAIELPRMVEAGERFGLVYVDGSHLFEDVFVDAYFVIRLLQPGGIVTFDDSANVHVAKVLRFLRRNYNRLIEEIDLAPYRPQGQHSFRYTIARRLNKVQLTAFRRIGPAEREWNAKFSSF